MDLIRNWFARNFSDPQVVILTAVLAAVVLTIVLFGRIMAPIIASAIIGYLLQGLVTRLQHLGIPRLAAVWIVFLSFVAVLTTTVIALLPILVQQTRQLIGQIPAMLRLAHDALMELPRNYPALVTPDQVDALVASMQSEVIAASQWIFTYTVEWLGSLMAAAIYLVLVPFLVFFFLRDQARIADWIAGFLPPQRDLTTKVWREIAAQTNNYVRGKLIEIAIVGVVSYVVFAALGLQYAALLGALSGLSALLPFIGAIAVTVPVAGVVYVQWGLGSELAYVLIAYTTVQVLDGYVLNPLLMSEAVNLHPIAVIVAILFFGGLWGFWGVFFAVPLATIVQAVLQAWPRAGRPHPGDSPLNTGADRP